jgi:hypothetical protein
MNENDLIFDKRLCTVILVVAGSILASMWLSNESFTAAFCDLLLIIGAVVLVHIAWRSSGELFARTNHKQLLGAGIWG